MDLPQFALHSDLHVIQRCEPGGGGCRQNPQAKTAPPQKDNRATNSEDPVRPLAVGFVQSLCLSVHLPVRPSVTYPEGGENPTSNF